MDGWMDEMRGKHDLCGAACITTKGLVLNYVVLSTAVRSGVTC